MYVSLGMVILVGMSSMKSFYKKTGASKKKWAHTESFLSALLSGGLDVPNIYIGPECAEFNKHLDTKSSL